MDIRIIGIAGGAAVVGAALAVVVLMPRSAPVAPAPTPAAAVQAASQPPAQAAPAEQVPQPAPAPATAAQPSAAPMAIPAPAPTGFELPPDSAMVVFEHAVAPYTVARDTPAYVGANIDSPQMYVVPVGTALISSNKSKDGLWVAALTEDGRVAYLKAADLGPFDPASVPQRQSQQTIVSGAARVVDTATLSVNGQQITLIGLIGKGGIYTDQLQDVIAREGGTVTCRLGQSGYLCQLPSGIDIGRVALFNGAAEPSGDASDDYLQQTNAAKAGHRGIWR